MGITLEEIKNDSALNGKEWAYNIDRFRELLPPEAMQKEISELLEEPVSI